MKVLLTGASGFIGSRFVTYNKDKFEIQTLSLQKTKVEDIDWEGVEVVIHMAGKAHQMTPIDDQIYFEVNSRLTEKLATAAKAKGVQQFVYLSSVKVYNDQQNNLKETTPCAPTDAYGASKLEAEQLLTAMNNDQFRVAIIRPPLVYGPGVKGNLIRLLELANKAWPLPFKSIQNNRTMVFLDNLIELINQTIDKKASGIFLAGDKEAISTEKLVSLIRKYMNKPRNLFTIPKPGLWFLGRLKPGLVKRLFHSFTIDTSNTNQRLGFVPPYSTEHGIEQMVEWYKKQQ